MEKDYLLQRAALSRTSWNDHDFDVVANGKIVGRILKSGVSVARPWMWTLIFPHHDDRTPTQGYAVTREAAMAAFARACGQSK
jgi:hypothetical protein